MDGAPYVYVDDSTEDDVEDCGEALKHPGRLQNIMAVYLTEGSESCKRDDQTFIASSGCRISEIRMKNLIDEYSALLRC